MFFELKPESLILGLATLVFLTPTAGAQSPPSWSTVVMTPTPAAVQVAPPSSEFPDPAPTPSTPPAPETPSPTPTTGEAGNQPMPTETSGNEEEAGETSASPTPAATTGGDDDQTPKSEQVTNPGAVAFTDYRPFDLDQIEPQTFDSKWQGLVAGIRGVSRYSLFDGKLKFRIGGQIQVDGTAGSGETTFDETFGPIDSQASLRNIVIYAVGRFQNLNFNASFDLGADWGLDATWVESAKGGLDAWGHHLGKLRIGLVYEPFSLERQTSSYNGGFMERSLPVATFAPGTNLGVKIHDSSRNGRTSWAAGLFSLGKSSDKNASTSLLSITGRFTCLPVYRDQGRHLVHVGGSFSSRSPTGGDNRYRTRPEARYVDYLVDTGNFDTSHMRLWGLEFAAVSGPLWLMAEYIQSDVSAQYLDDPSFAGSYVQVGWFLTGESRPYRTNSGTFDRVLPSQKYSGGSPFKKGSSGAWELAARISTVDLTDGLVAGGEMTDFTAALSWYANATTRIELNYIHTSPRDEGSANIILLRLQYLPW